MNTAQKTTTLASYARHLKASNPECISLASVFLEDNHVVIDRAEGCSMESFDKIAQKLLNKAREIGGGFEELDDNNAYGIKFSK